MATTWATDEPTTGNFRRVTQISVERRTIRYDTIRYDTIRNATQHVEVETDTFDTTNI